MAQPDPKPAATQQAATPFPAEEFKQSLNLTRKILERATPWLVEFGSWVFGGLIAFTLLVMAALIPLGLVDRAVTIALTTLALALPLNVAGLFLLRLIQDKRHTGFVEEWEQVLEEGEPGGGAKAVLPRAREARQKRRTGVVLVYCLGLLAVSALLTMTGMTATLWHAAWWIGAAFLAMTLISQGIVIAALITLEPPETPEEQARMQRYWERVTKKAKRQEEGAP